MDPMSSTTGVDEKDGHQGSDGNQEKSFVVCTLKESPHTTRRVTCRGVLDRGEEGGELRSEDVFGVTGTSRSPGGVSGTSGETYVVCLSKLGPIKVRGPFDKNGWSTTGSSGEVKGRVPPCSRLNE